MSKPTPGSIESLRAERKARLAAGEKPSVSPSKGTPASAAPAAKPTTKTAAPTTAKPESVSKPATKETPKAAKTEPTPAAKPIPREITASISDPNKIDADVAIDIAGPFNAKTDNPNWIITAGGKPLAEICLNDQTDKESLRKHFTHEQYGKTVLHQARVAGLKPTLEMVKARPYIAAVRGTDVVKEIEENLVTATKAALKEKVARYHSDLLGMVNVVVEGQAKNFYDEQPLKTVFCHALRTAGIVDPGPMVDACFREAAVANLEVQIKLAQGLLDMDPTAMAMFVERIKAAPFREASYDAPQPKAAAAGNSHKTPIPRESANVPVAGSRVAGGIAPAAPADSKANLRNVLFGSRG